MGEKTGTLPSDPTRIVEKVRERYGRIATGEEAGCCGPAAGSTCGDPTTEAASRIGYQDRDLESMSEGANLGLGCGAPVGVLNLKAGETVLDLGSGAGFDAFLASRQVGDTGRVIGVDMTLEMIEKARANAAEGGFTRVEFRQGRLESLPVEDASVDAVTSNCVINLVPDKSAVFREVARVLRPGGRRSRPRRERAGQRGASEAPPAAFRSWTVHQGRPTAQGDEGLALLLPLVLL